MVHSTREGDFLQQWQTVLSREVDSFGLKNLTKLSFYVFPVFLIRFFSNGFGRDGKLIFLVVTFCNYIAQFTFSFIDSFN